MFQIQDMRWVINFKINCIRNQLKICNKIRINLTKRLNKVKKLINKVTKIQILVTILKMILISVHCVLLRCIDWKLRKSLMNCTNKLILRNICKLNRIKSRSRWALFLVAMMKLLLMSMLPCWRASRQL